MATAPKTAPEPKAAPILRDASPPMTTQAAPWWVSLIPDMRGWAAAGFFALAGYLLHMIEVKPELLNSAPFMQFAGMVMTGGVLLVGSYLFGANKAGADASAKMVDALKDSNPPNP